MTVESMVWVDPTGVITPLMVAVNSQLGDITGRFSPPVLHLDDVLPFQPGGRHRLAIHGERDIVLPFNTSTTSTVALRTALRNLLQAMNPLRGAGILRCVSPLGDTREIECYYVSGLEIGENLSKYGVFNQGTYVTFRAYDPYWRDTTDLTLNWALGTPPSFFPIFPMRLAKSSLVVQSTVTNSGDVVSWPVWSIYGPGGGADGIVLTNVTTNQSITFMTTVLGTGESITIDTRPGYKTVTKNDGSNLFTDLDPASVLWPLQSGNNALNLVLNNASISGTILSMSYRRKYLTP